MTNAGDHHFFAPARVMVETCGFRETRHLPAELGMACGLLEYELALAHGHMDNEI
jgi:hypothetical protein